MSPPPGNKGGAVSGAGLCALATEVQSDRTNDRTTPANATMKYRFRILTNGPPMETDMPKHTTASNREPTGGTELDTKWQKSRDAGDGWGVTVRRNYAVREIEAINTDAGSWQYCEYKKGQ